MKGLLPVRRILGVLVLLWTSSAAAQNLPKHPDSCDPRIGREGKGTRIDITVGDEVSDADLWVCFGREHRKANLAVATLEAFGMLRDRR